MEIVLASNFDDALVDGVRELPVSTFFGNFPTGLTGGGRPPHVLPPVEPDRFRAHVRKVHAAGRRFYATLNSNDLGLREYAPEFPRAFLANVDALLDLGVDGFVVALPLLIDLLHDAHPDVPVSVSTFARIRTVTQAEYFLRRGARTIVLEEANRDFALLRGLVAAGAEVEVLVNQTCLQGCPYRFHHLNTSSLASQTGRSAPRLEFPIAQCGWELVRDPSRLISAIFVRPEDLAAYEELGISRFKVSGRNRSTPWLVRAARAYTDRRYVGNLLDILSYVQIKAPLGFLSAPQVPGTVAPPAREELAAAYAGLADLTIDNGAFPAGFLRRIAATDCEHTACSTCGYCAGIARKVVRIRGRPLAEYVAPKDRSLGTELLPFIPCAPA